MKELFKIFALFFITLSFAGGLAYLGIFYGAKFISGQSPIVAAAILTGAVSLFGTAMCLPAIDFRPKRKDKTKGQ